MPVQRYSVNQYPIDIILSWIRSDEIAIPDIQRPFVWTAVQVRDFIDSLYYGYPVGYLIAWRNPNVRLKDGSQSAGKRILIDGQQRATALMAALLGRQVVGQNYKRKHIQIAFNPVEEKFEVANPAISKNREWLDDITTVFAPDMKTWSLVQKYCEANQGTDKDEIYDRIERLKSIQQNSIGLIELNSDLDVETVAEIFVRINSKGVKLNAADFVMSKMAASEKHDGHQLRKCIDYFCHLVIAPEAYNELSKDKEFVNTDYFQAMQWLKDEKDDLYDPSYIDMLRVAFTSEFKRGRLEDLVALLSGRNFQTREYEEVIAGESFQRLGKAVLRYMNQTNFKRFVMILRSAGFIECSMIRSQNTVNFAYILYLTLRRQGVNSTQIETLVRRWFVMSMLTSRYSASSETAFGVDIQNLDQQGADSYLDEVERAELSDDFWNVGLPQQLNTSAVSSSYFNVFLASQVKGNIKKEDKGFLSTDHSVSNLLQGSSHIHHIFPRNYLKKKGLPRSSYNQIANYVVMQSEINIKIGDTPPDEYLQTLRQQCKDGIPHYGSIIDVDQLNDNLAEHCIPQGIEMNFENYDNFLQERRKLMAVKIRDYYRNL